MYRNHRKVIKNKKIIYTESRTKMRFNKSATANDLEEECTNREDKKCQLRKQHIQKITHQYLVMYKYKNKGFKDKQKPTIPAKGAQYVTSAQTKRNKGKEEKEQRSQVPNSEQL